ncbi:unnamed protein product [Cuscuta europaea]|uniref:DUF6598 domain-containing protein n=1 Tax=Cuscuta europaea TaxID=41803 RepID=A0A9P1EGM9_CUSEU|nr:unnamed protein product [Cuscuta europaea]
MSKPWPSRAIEIFSVFVGRQNSNALRIYGSLEILSDDHQICLIFKRDRNDALDLLKHLESTIGVLDGLRGYEECPLEIKIDLKDAEDRLSIKGYVDWQASALESSSWCDKQLCNVFQGENGFATVHYSIFSKAVQAVIKTSLNFKMGYVNDCSQKVYGSLIAHYNCFDYSSRYTKEYYRSVLFRRIEDEVIELNADSTLPLSRSMVVVPAYSSLVIDVDLDISGQKLLCTQEIKIGEGWKTIEINDCLVCFELEWCEIK